MSSTPTEETKLSVDSAYSALVGMRQNYEQMLWQAPVLSLTAQAFLLTIAFDIAGGMFYRVVAGVMASAIGFASWQLFLRHRYFEREASERLQKLEEAHLGFAIHKARGEVPQEKALYGIVSIKGGPLWAWCLFLLSFGGLFPAVEWLYCFYMK